MSNYPGFLRNRAWLTPAALAILALALLACQRPSPTLCQAETCGYQVEATYPHDMQAWTQGLQFVDGVLYESTGRYGESSLRKVDLESGSVLQIVPLADGLYGEGLTVLGDKIYQITWRNRVGLIYDRESLALLGQFSYPTEGWGLTTDGQQLIMSDGTNTLYFRDPETFEEVDRVQVYDGDRPITNLNELEYVEGEILANVLNSDYIARIAPEDGRVVGWLKLNDLLGPEERSQGANVLNGIAYDDASGRLLVTGKFWPKLFLITLLPQD